MAERRTYKRFALKTIMPAQGWQAVYYTDGAHHLGPVYALALAYLRTREVHTGELIAGRHIGPEDEDWEIVGLDYGPGDGWQVWDEVSNFCGLLPPDMTLEAFCEANISCQHHPAKETPHDPD